jgi:hypothetical protein
LDALRDFTQELSAFDAAPRWHVVSAAAVLALAAAFYAPRAPSEFRAEYDAKT